MDGEESILGAAPDTETAGEGEEKATDAAQQGDESGTPPADGKQGEKAEEGGEKPAPIEIKLPEGVEADETLVDALKGAAKDSESAQKLVDAYVAAQKASVEKQQEAHQAQVKAWAEELRADKEFGGANFDGNVKAAHRAMAQFGSDELREFLNSSGLGNHPILVKTFANIGKAIAEDNIAGTSSAGRAESDAEKVYRDLFPNSFKE